MIQALFSGISGMKAFKSSLDVIGNNIANVNTTGYKSGRATFKEMLSQTLSGGSGPTDSLGGTNPSQVGLGVLLGTIDTDQTQGSMTSTGRKTDAAIEGNGYFVLGNGKRNYFTRDGAFALDAKNYLVASSNGMKVGGWTPDPVTGVIDTSSPIGPTSGVRIPIGELSIAKQTAAVDIGGNLDATSADGTSYEMKFDVYDSLGITHQMNLKFTKTTTPGEWTYEAVCPDVDPAVPVTPGTPVPVPPAASVTAGTLAFDTLGASTTATVPLSLTFAIPTGAITPLDFEINLAKMTQLNGANTADMTYQDGLPLGTLESFNVDRSGKIAGTFTNGSTRNLGQLTLCAFNNPAGLMKSGANLMIESANSGTPRMGMPGEGSLGMISAGFLEASNVDLASEFSQMIISQRGFQANSKIITTSDEILNDLVNLKR